MRVEELRCSQKSEMQRKKERMRLVRCERCAEEDDDDIQRRRREEDCEDQGEEGRLSTLLVHNPHRVFLRCRTTTLAQIS